MRSTFQLLSAAILFFMTATSQGQSVAPATVTLRPHQTQLFSVKMAGINRYTWSISPSSGSITTQGAYTAPASITAESTVTVYAIWPGHPVLSATVTLMPLVSIAILPTWISMTNGQSAAFTATVTGASDTQVTWTNPSIGSVTSGGVYTVPMNLTGPQNITLTVKSVADRTKTASATIALVPTISVSLNPSSNSLAAGQSTAMNATVNGTTNAGLNWSLSPHVGILSNGVYTAPSPITVPQTVTVTAASQASPGTTASAQLTLVPVSIRVTPPSASLSSGHSATFSATVNGSSNTAVNWSLSRAVGTITNGVYTAPALVTSAQTITLTATSAADHTKSASATVSLRASVSLTMTPSSASLTGGQSTTFKATVSGSSNSAVNWSMSPSIGTLSNGVYTAPATISCNKTITVTAVSAADPSKKVSAAISLVPASVAVSISMSPSTASLTGGQSTTFKATVSGSSNTAVNWSMSPSIGTLSNGVYTAPALISMQQNVRVAAASGADPTKLATAVVTLIPTISVAVLPSSATLSGGQSVQLNASLSGTNDPNVSWSLSPLVGTLTGGLYQAPASINAGQNVVVTAASLADPTKTSGAVITLVPVIGVTLAPSSVSLAGGQSIQFNATIGGTPNVAGTWSLAPSVGTITSGLYLAPASISTLQTITATFASSTNPIQTASAAITLMPAAATTVTPSSASLSAGQSVQFSASINGQNTAAINWSLVPVVGTVTNGLYTAPGSVSAQQTVVLTATSASDPSKVAQASITLIPQQAITLPIEVVGPAGNTETVSVTIPPGTDLSTTPMLWMQIHGLRYADKGSVQVNNMPWVPLDNNTVTLLGNAASYGGIGGGFGTLKMTLNLTPGTLVPGANTISFRFNGPSGVGFRVLKFNFMSANGAMLLTPDVFVQDDPSLWQPPLPSPADIAEGKLLFQQATIVHAGFPTQAHCNNCHTTDGRDLKYFNYSNKFIHRGAVISGLTDVQGDQIASYIRSLNTPSPGRPWNPPYQPGPGLDTRPTEEWAAGAGIDAVLDDDASMLPYLAPGGSTAGWASNMYLNPRELPIAMQLPDWNHWMPQVNPIDAFGADFTNSEFYTDYAMIRSELQPNNPAAYKNSLNAFNEWATAQGTFLGPIEATANWDATNLWGNNNLRVVIYSAVRWKLLKEWGLNQEFGLEAMPQVPFGSTANPRGWFGADAFYCSPNMQHIPFGPLLGDGTKLSQVYLAYIWYHLQLILNDGQGQEVDHDPIDFGYTDGFVKDLSLIAQAPEAMLQMTWKIKVLQEETLSGAGPEKGQYGWHPTWTAPAALVDSNWQSIWSETSPALRVTLTEAYVRAWFAQVQKFTPQQFYQGGWASAADDPAKLFFETTFGGQMWFMLPRLRYYGIDPNLTYQISAWAATIWPLGNWTLNNSATCSNGLTCTSGY